ncbi:4a-hydroxytetrahydrobiopterin dehydratase [Amycolatopsis rhizosphaerae]|uniref:Putative pterin-4-alpha-carbinolamine dehydratase n=1 Tax=Amycolatopsis rhizosphaerae TaxID=2053003 RepID=A0A558CN00_9PSEU|nr:4a-hydroxytetrahydrobiopterin dehydratase [Amycolatopsis rhizosphaerae]TVT50105.1 4a-hydroxytetrahydrobiopterin dehydratase [Amycolatopsis rhizosphaerae]
MAELLTDDEISDALTKLPHWHVKEGPGGERGRAEGAEFERTAELGTFTQAIQAVNRIAEIAESLNHHPDIDIRWRNLTFHLSTHSAGGLTRKDTSLAEQIDEVVDAL